MVSITASCVRQWYGEMAGVAKPAVHSPTWLCTISNIAAIRAKRRAKPDHIMWLSFSSTSRCRDLTRVETPS